MDTERPGANYDENVVSGFGEEWRRFDQRSMGEAEGRELFARYFEIFPWAALPGNAEGFDAGCGSGRWAKFAAPRVGILHCVDASRVALQVATENLSTQRNCTFHLASIDNMPLADGAMDFGYSLGVLHHVPDTASALRACVAKLKPGAPFLLYLYYRFDNRPPWFKALWTVSNAVRLVISRCPFRVRSIACDAAATAVYWPLARLAAACERLGVSVEHFPLAAYRHHSFYVMRTDALDRFGTGLEKRFTRSEITAMMESAGLRDITFHDDWPYWVAVGRRLGA